MVNFLALTACPRIGRCDLPNASLPKSLCHVSILRCPRTFAFDQSWSRKGCHQGKRQICLKIPWTVHAWPAATRQEHENLKAPNIEWGYWNAVLGMSFSMMLTRWYPKARSVQEKTLAPRRWSKNWHMARFTYPCMSNCAWRYSQHIRSFPGHRAWTCSCMPEVAVSSHRDDIGHVWPHRLHAYGQTLRKCGMLSLNWGSRVREKGIPIIGLYCPWSKSSAISSEGWIDPLWCVWTPRWVNRYCFELWGTLQVLAPV